MNSNVSSGGRSSDRIRSGLVRQFTGWAAFLFGIHCISLSSSGFIPYSWVAGVWPGASIVGVLTIALVFCLIHAACYSIIGSTASRAGADYVLASRVLNPVLGFAASWTLVVFSGVVAGGLAAWVPKSALPALLRPMAVILQKPEFSQIADFTTSTFGTIVVGLMLVVVVMITVLQSGRFLTRALVIGFVLVAVAWAIILVTFATSSGPEAFRTAWDKFMVGTGGYGSFDQRIALAKSAGMHVSNSPWTMTLAGLIMGFWIFYGYYIPTFFSEEVRKPERTLFRSAIWSLLIAYAIFAAGALLLQRLVPLEWLAAEGYLFNNPSAVEAVTGETSFVAMPWITFYAAILVSKPILIYFITFAWIFSLVNLVQTYFFYAGRIVYSWALDRAVPDWVLGKTILQPSPKRATIIIAVLASLGVLDAATNGPLNTQLTFVFFAVITQLVPVISLIVIPWKNKYVFDSMPRLVRTRYFGIPLASWIAAVTLLYLVWMIVASFLFPAVGISSPGGTLLLLAIIAVSGVLEFYLVRWHRKKKEGINLADTYKDFGAIIDDEVEFE